MKAYFRGLVALVVVILAAVYWAAQRPDPAGASAPAPVTVTTQVPPPPASAPVAPATPVTSPPTATLATTAPAPAAAQPVTQPASKRLTLKSGQPIPQLFPYEAERDELFRLAASQDETQIPTIASSLQHKDKVVRDAALQALLQMGNVNAVPHLKQAMAKATNPEEVQQIREAIEFLSLPKFMDVMTTAANTAGAEAKAP